MKETKSITLTYEQINLLVCYLLMTTRYRKGEEVAWKQLAQENPENETIKRNYQWYKDLSRKLKEIINTLEA